ncbi:FkbM family methyltransferase [Chachezhania antarctica]|uniref:FkbM family methyltransferase n=1 Tax=Chachezhania antarctica TaxID=2340860 RepID=UPI000EAC38FD|nr:FkbM family methyltransferase [Chachezhania antarctica]|tara:strand:- start:6919 stop:8751 length:1833 start_codon:yes stop_codon:yes gene_type:complete
MNLRRKLFNTPPEDLTIANVSAFGQDMEILHSGDAHEARTRLAEVREVYEPFLASRVIPKDGLLADVGAGAGWFALPFAKAFPSWHVVCFEPDADCFRSLEATVQYNKFKNVTCIHAAFHPDAALENLPEPGFSKTLVDAMRAGEPAPFRRLPGIGFRLAPAGDVQGGAIVDTPCIAPALLAAASPDLVKLDAPGVETALAQALHGAPTTFLTGKLYTHVPSRLLLPEDARRKREIYLPHGRHVVRRDFEDGFDNRQPKLDIVVALYNARAYILECIDSLLADGNPDIEILVVDDGSTDDSGDIVARRFDGNPRVKLLPKANGGCASARNYGRLHSQAAHIAFVDADDRVDPGLFSSLLEVARYTGLNMVEGEFVFFDVDEDGDDQFRPSYEKDTWKRGPDRQLGGLRYAMFDGIQAMHGQPSIWRRVYRRDFLDNRDIVFPEHVRAFDDQIFQLLSAYHCGRAAHVFGHSYHYRQHAAQDIKQGDERHFYSFDMFRQVFQRAQAEAWLDIRPAVESLLNTMHWSYDGLRPDLKPIYQDAAVEFLAMIARTFGREALADVNLARVGIDGLDFLTELRLQAMVEDKTDYNFTQMENWRWQPEFIRMMQASR